MTTTPELGKGRQQQPQQQWRLFINCVGVVDALEFEARKNVIDLQRDDVRDLGRLILTLGTGTEITKSSDAETLQACEMYLAQHYSRDLHSLAVTLIRSANPPTIMDVCRAMAGRIFDELDSAHMAYDRCEQALASEYDSGRALRLLLKLGFINERPEFGMNRRWAQSGDCYVLTLFRDYGTSSGGNCYVLRCLTSRTFNSLDSLSPSRRRWKSCHGFRACHHRIE
jgi:PAB-dependent poly(A)-specific ribonuclease subunit 3